MNSFAQQISLEEWNQEAKSNIRLLPKYGLVPKTKEQKELDESLVNDMLNKGYTRRKASEEFIDLGFKYLYKDIKTAMYRFNQAYLMDSSNVDIYWGYGGVYLVLGDIERAKDQYQIGLTKDDRNAKILTDLATCYMIEFYSLSQSEPDKANARLENAIDILTKSYKIDQKNQNTLFKISACYLNKRDCSNALKFYNECLKLGGDPVTEEYKVAIKDLCDKK
jgi:tetratricopeptide (TPR) repeat protein